MYLFLITSLALFYHTTSLGSGSEHLLGDPLLIMEQTLSNSSEGFQVRVIETRPEQKNARLKNYFSPARELISITVSQEMSAFAAIGTKITDESISFGHILLLDPNGGVTAVPASAPSTGVRLNLDSKIISIQRSADLGALLLDNRGRVIEIGSDLGSNVLLELGENSSIVGVQKISDERIAVLSKNGELSVFSLNTSNASLSPKIITTPFQEADEFLFGREGSIWLRKGEQVYFFDALKELLVEFARLEAGDFARKEIHFLFIDEKGFLIAQYGAQAVRFGLGPSGAKEVRILSMNFFTDVVRGYGVNSSIGSRLLPVSPPNPDQRRWGGRHDLDYVPILDSSKSTASVSQGSQRQQSMPLEVGRAKKPKDAPKDAPAGTKKKCGPIFSAVASFVPAPKAPPNPPASSNPIKNLILERYGP